MHTHMQTVSLALQGARSHMQGTRPFEQGVAEGERLFLNTVPRANCFYHKLIGSVNRETGEALTDAQITTQGLTFILAGTSLTQCDR